MSSKKKIARRGLLIVGGICVALSILEIVARATDTRALPIYDASRGWKLRPATVVWYRSEGSAMESINSGGFRGPEISLKKNKKTLRIAVIGDSFSEARQVEYEKTFCAIAERMLKQNHALDGRDVEVLDFGVSGYGTVQELLTLREEVWRYSPDVVVLAFFSGNDISNNSEALDLSFVINGKKCRPYAVLRDGTLVITRDFTKSLIPCFWCRVHDVLSSVRALKFMGDPLVDLYIRLVDAHTQTRPIAGHEPGIDDEIYAPPKTPAWQDAWSVTEALVAQMNREVKAKGVLFLAMTLSNPTQDYPDTAYRATYLSSVGGTDVFYPDRRIRALGSREGFAVLTLAPTMQGYSDTHHVFLHGFANTAKGFGHWNEAGHRIAGDLLAKEIYKLICGQPGVSSDTTVSFKPSSPQFVNSCLHRQSSHRLPGPRLDSELFKP